MTMPVTCDDPALSDRVLALCRSCGAHTRLEANIILHLSEDQADSWYLIERGSVLLFDVDREGRRLGLDVVRAGDLVEDGMITGRRRVWAAETQEPTSLFELPAHCLADCIAADRTLMMAVFERLLECQQRWTEILAALLQRDVSARLAYQLHRLARLIGTPTAGGVTLELTHQQLADLSWTARPTVSHAISRFRRLGMLSSESQRGRLEIADRGRLAEMAEINTRHLVKEECHGPVQATDLVREARPGNGRGVGTVPRGGL